MELKDALKKVESSETFLDWKKDHHDSFLAHALVMFDGKWHLGYFDQNKITSFLMNDEVVISDGQDVLSSGETIEPLDLSMISISPSEAFEIAESVRKNNYSSELITNKFFILQSFGKKPIYNATLLTRSFKTLNVKIDASTKEVISHSLAVLADFG